jgi:hypothetical protein
MPQLPADVAQKQLSPMIQHGPVISHITAFQGGLQIVISLKSGFALGQEQVSEQDSGQRKSRFFLFLSVVRIGFLW